MIRRFCAYELEFKDSDGFTHDWCTLITALELAYRTSIHYSTGKTQEMLEQGDFVLVSTLNLNNIKGPKKLNESFAGPFMIKALHGPNAVQLELTGELMKKHPDFPVSLIKPYISSDKELFPLRNKPPFEIPPLEEGEEKKIIKVLK
ncbi:hypothetical protein O181_004082 [Austropuccinia psidii MF-1]|uniref:Tf2-1-like SH3-like domain-containing protein n=1 Tax=Austropuccinia psidii MF-1 TaxID=1389203 RepID=A0A9Q3GFG1_9BASI|nr:hypothetical protein [Austropuccinia psidii MF-1]